MKIVTQSYFEHKGWKRLFGLGTDEADIVNDVSYIAYKQHFFGLTDVPFQKRNYFQII
jgi:YidC/Oxa1 family membrane protein insertase